MKQGFESNLRCLTCGASAWSLEVTREDAREIREGRLLCRACPGTYPIERGIVSSLDPKDEALAREVQGWHELAGPLDESLVTVMAGLPGMPHAPWTLLAPDFFQIFELVDFRGQKVVDLGSGRTWSARHISLLGEAREVVAVDVLTRRFLGLETADIFFELDHCHFERIRGDIHQVPIRDGWADIVFSAASVHHSPDLPRLFVEAWRLLRPGGRFVFVGEPSKKASIPERQPANEEVAHGINEHLYSFREYSSALEDSGFAGRHVASRSIHHRLLHADPGIPPLLRLLGRTLAGRNLVLRLLANRLVGPLVYRYANLPLSMIATKRASPSRARRGR